MNVQHEAIVKDIRRTPSRISETGQFGHPKETQYGWPKRNAPPELAYVHKNVLQIDHSYQRDLNDGKRQRIASDFNWGAFGVLQVSKRKETGELFVFDGQHRLAAARSRSDIQDLPVAIFELADGLHGEASDFLAANKDRKPLSGIDSFKAMMVTRDEKALVVDLLIREAGREVGLAGPRTVACVVNLYNFAKVDQAALVRAWPTITTLCEGERMDNRLIGGLFTLERKLVDMSQQKRSISEPKLNACLLKAGFGVLMRSIAESSAYYKRGGELVFARGCLNVLNYKRQHRFALMGVEAGE